MLIIHENESRLTPLLLLDDLRIVLLIGQLAVIRNSLLLCLTEKGFLGPYAFQFDNVALQFRVLEDHLTCSHHELALNGLFTVLKLNVGLVSLLAEVLVDIILEIGDEFSDFELLLGDEVEINVEH